MIDCSFEELEGPVKGVVVTGRNAGATGVVVLTGSSGRIDVDRARLFAETGVKALALRWFGGVGQSPGICEIPLETFCHATDYLISIGCQRIVFVGTSKGAEAALLVATIDPRVDVVVAISPTSVVWGNVGPGEDGIAWPERSSWSLKGLPLDFVPADPDLRPEYRDGLISYRRLFEHCLISHEDAVRRARIPIEKASAEIVVVAGGDDALWPSDRFARELVDRRKENGKSASLLYDREAGHRILLPGENTPRSALHAHGGRDDADARLGQATWQTISTLL